jgi:menaquinone-dependent protoporphyrinogen oxidase
MKILIVYATSEGQTRKIAEYIATELRHDADEVTVYDSELALGELAPDSFDAIFLAGSVHDQAHQENLVAFAIAHRNTLAAIPSALLSVSLAAATENGMAEAQSYVDRFVEETGWQPSDTLLVAGALRYSEYDYFRQQIIKSVTAAKDGTLDPEQNQEFTDWEQVISFARIFMQKAGV